MPTLKPIRMTLIRRVHASGQKSVHPDFKAHFDVDPSAYDNKLPHDFFTEHGGLHYNKVSNLGTGAANGEAMVFLPPANANQILAAGIEGVFSVTDESEVEDFYDNKAHVHEPANFEDERVLQSLAAKRQMGMKETASDRAALDPDDLRSGIRRNANKTWTRYKAARSITLSFA